MASIHIVHSLERAELKSDAPEAQVPQPAVSVDASIGSGGAGGDGAAEAAMPEEFREEMRVIGKLRAFISDGEMLTRALYCFRSCVPALPQPRGDSSTADKARVYLDTYRVLRPEVEKLMTLMQFCEGLVEAVPDALAYLLRKSKAAAPVPRQVVEGLLRLLDLALKIDTVTDMKTSIMNTFSCYMKALKLVTSNLPDGEEQMARCQELRLFLKTNLIKGSARYERAMKQAKQKAGGSGEADTLHLLLFLANPLEIDMRVFRTFRDQMQDDATKEVLIQLLDRACEMYHDEWYIDGDGKHSLVRAMALIVMLVDGKDDDPRKHRTASAYSNPAVTKTKVFKILKEYPVLPMYPDMPVQLHRLLAVSASFTPQVWADLVGVEEARRALMAKKYDLVNSWRDMRDEFRRYSTVFTRVLDEVTSLVNDHKDSEGSALAAVPPVVVSDAMDVAWEGLRLLGQWQAKIAEQTAWKMYVVRPKSVCIAMGGQADRRGFSYEQAVRFNYTSEQRSVMIDAIAMIKSLASLMVRGAAELTPLFRVGMHAEVQDLCHGITTRLLTKAHKKHKAAAAQFLTLRSIAAEWPPGTNEEEYKSARDREFPHQEVNRRVCAPTSAQLTAMRIGTQAILDPNSAANKVGNSVASRLFRKKLISPAKETALRNWEKRLFMYPWLEDFAESVRVCSFLGDLWYRERFLAMSHCVQFPIESSLPWTLTEHAITCNAPPTLQSLMYVFDVYNDAARAALHDYRQQFLFDEVEAEVNLVFDQFVFLLSDAIFNFARDRACSLLLDTEYCAKYEAAHGVGSLSRDARRFEIQLLQRNLQLLGRQVDVCGIISVQINATIRAALESAITRFEGDSVTSVVELRQHLSILEHVHRQLVEEGLSLDPWPLMYAEVVDIVHPADSMSRIALSVILQLANELLPLYIYNDTTQRFVVSPLTKASESHAATVKEQKSSRSKHAMVGKDFKVAYHIMQKPLRGYFGMEHCEALVHLLGPGALSVVVEELMTQVITRLKEEFALFVPNLLNGFPPVDRLPQFQYRLGACYWFFLQKMIMLLKYEDLKPCVFVPLREIGNTLAFIRMLDSAQRRLSMHTRSLVLPFVQSPGAGSGATGAGAGSGGPSGPIRDILGAVAGSTPPASSSAADPAHHGVARTADGRPIKSAFTMLSLQASVGRLSSMCRAYTRPVSLFSTALARLNRALDDKSDGPSLREQWTVVPGTGADASDVVLNVESTPDLWRLWSALLFLYCVPQVRGDEAPHEVDTSQPNDVEEFGDGFLLAGTVLLHLLRQRLRFEAADFTSHLLRCARYERASVGEGSSMVGQVDQAILEAAGRFITTASPAWDRMQQMFAVAESAFDNTRVADHYQRLQFVPPSDDSDLVKHACVDTKAPPAQRQSLPPAPQPRIVSTTRRSVSPVAAGAGSGAGSGAGAGSGIDTGADISSVGYDSGDGNGDASAAAAATHDEQDGSDHADDAAAAADDVGGASAADDEAGDVVDENPANNPEFAPYFKMVRMGVPIGSVRNKMKREGLDPAILDWRPAGEQEQETEEVMTCADDPELAPFYKMLRVGVPKQAVRNKMRRAGYDDSLLDTPDAPSPNA